MFTLVPTCGPLLKTKHHGFTEEEMLEKCDIKLLYIEPGVFGVLHSKPAMPPPPSRTAQFESATEILPSLGSSDDSVASPLNLCVTGNNDGNSSPATGNNSQLLVPNLDNATEQPVADAMNSVKPPDISTVLTDTRKGASEQSLPGIQNFDLSVIKLSKPLGFHADRLNCVVKLTRLEDVISSEISDDAESDEHVYNLRVKNKEVPCRAPRAVKRKVNYKQDSDFSSDEHQSPPRKRSKPAFPLRGPSRDRIAACTRSTNSLKDREKVAAEALIGLSNTDETAIGNNTSEEKTSFTGNVTDGCSTSTGSTGSSTSSTSTSSSSSGSHSSSEDLVQNVSSSDDNDSNENLDAPNTSSDEDNIPLSKVKAALHKNNDAAGKPKGYFKTTQHGLKRPRKRLRNFPCSKCKFTGTSQGELNSHFLDKHGELQCSKCPKKCATISAYRKHQYDHSDLATKYPCADCNKSYAFSSQLKNHRKLHLTALEHGCIHCPKHFKRKGELVKHLVTHGKKMWCCSKCTYSSKDPRNVKAHMHSHGNKTRYQCVKCKEGFNHYMQWKRHREKDDCT